MIDPGTLLWLGGLVAGQLQQQRETRDAEELAAQIYRMSEGLEEIQASLVGLLVAPYDEALATLRQARAATGPTRADLLVRARGKFSDAAARPDAPVEVRARAALLTAWCWLVAGEKQLAEAELAHTLSLTEAWGRSLEADAFDWSGVEMQDPPAYLRLDEVREFGAEVRLQAALLQGDPDALTERSPATGLPDLPTAGAYQVLGGGLEPLSLVWHRLRRLLLDDAVIAWYAQATDLRLLQTTTTLYVWSSEELRQGRLRFVAPLTSVTVSDRGRDWFDSYLVLREGTNSQRVNLGPESHARAVAGALDAALR